MRKLEKLVTADPPKPHIGPPDPPDGPGKRKMAKINIIRSSNDIFLTKNYATNHPVNTLSPQASAELINEFSQGVQASCTRSNYIY